MKLRTLRYALLLSAFFGMTFLLRAALPTVSTGTWVAAGNLSAARSGACTVVLSDGRLLVSGGADANGPTATADLFSTTGNWSAAASMTSARAHQSCAVLQDGRVLVAGGTTSGGGVTNSVEIYDPNADSWSSAGSMNDARSSATTSVLQDGRVLIAGGLGSGAALNTLEIFDSGSGAFSNAGTMSSPRQDHSAAVLSDGRVLIAGGSSDGTNALATTDIYDPQTGSVSAGPAMSTARARHTATTLLDGTVVVIGGSDYTNDLASAEFFDPAANNFNSVSSLATARSKHSAFLLPNSNEVLVVGGQSAGTDLGSAELYLPWQKAFQATGAMATPRSDATGAALTKVDGNLLIAGGSSASAELYGFATVKTDAADYPPGSTVTITGSGWQPGETVTLTLVESPLIDTHGPFTTVADAFGNISDSSFVTDTHDLNIRFYLTAVGSQAQAQNTFTDAPANTTTTITSHTPNPSVFGQAVTFNVSVTSTSTVNEGCAHIEDSGTSVSGLVGVVNGAAAVSVSTFTVGTHSSVTAVYTDNGSGCNNGNSFKTSTSAAVSQTVTKANTTTIVTLTTGTNPSVFGQSLTFTAQVSPVAPGAGFPSAGETITFNDGAAIGTGPLNGTGQATFITSTLSATSHSITAVYGGDTNFLTSTSPNLTQTVNKATPVITWANPADISFGTALSATQLNATTSVPGTFTYTPASGTLLNAGNAQALSVDFTPTDITNYNSVNGTTVHINVLKGTPVITWPNPSNITYGTALSATQLNATANVPGTFVYTPAAGTFLGGGANQTLSVTFTPTDTLNYNSATKTQSINVQKAQLSVTANDKSKTYGDANPTLDVSYSGFVLGDTASVLGGTLTCTTTATTLSPVGAYPITCTGQTSTNYTISYTAGTLTVNRANQTITWLDPAGITYGTALSATQLNATVAGVTGGTAPGALTYTPAAGTVLNAGNVQVLQVDAAATVNYNAATKIVHINVAKADATVSVTPYHVTYDGNAHTATGTATGVGGADLSASLTLTGTTHTNAGDYPSDAWSFSGGTNYNDASGTVHNSIAKATAIIVVTPYNVTYDGNPHTATGTATGVGGADLSAGLTLTGTTHTNAGDYPADAWSFAGGVNYNDASGTVHDSIAKANATINVTPYTVTYTGTAHTATGTAKGVLNEALSGLDLSGTTHTNAGDYPADPWSFTNANYKDASGSVHDNIAKANATINVTPYSVTYDGAAHSATGTAKGVLNESLSGLDLSGTTHTNPGDYPTDPWSFTDVTGNYKNSSGTVHDQILYSTGMCLGSPGHTILQPIDLTGASVFPKKQGSTVPAKFRVCDVSGNNSIGTPGVVTDFKIIQIFNGTVYNTANEDVISTTPDTAFRWDSSGQQWIYNISTKLLSAGNTYYFRISLNDGSTIDFHFGLK